MRIKDDAKDESYRNLDFKLTKTLPDRPGSPPQSLTAPDVTANSVTLSWAPPLVPNGIIEKYVISYAHFLDHGKSWSKPKVTISDGNSSALVIDKLLSFTRYEVNVTACTLAAVHGGGNAGCSDSVAKIGFTTREGPPAQPPPPAPKFINSTYVTIRSGVYILHFQRPMFNGLN